MNKLMWIAAGAAVAWFVTRALDGDAKCPCKPSRVPVGTDGQDGPASDATDSTGPGGDAELWGIPGYVERAAAASLDAVRDLEVAAITIGRNALEDDDSC